MAAAPPFCTHRYVRFDTTGAAFCNDCGVLIEDVRVDVQLGRITVSGERASEVGGTITTQRQRPALRLIPGGKA